MSISQTARLFYLISNRLSSTFFNFFSNSFLMNLCLADSLFTLSYPVAFVNYFFEFFRFFINLRKFKRRRRDLNPRAALATYTLSRGTSSASRVLLQSPNNSTMLNLECAFLTAHELLYLIFFFLSTVFSNFILFFYYLLQVSAFFKQNSLQIPGIFPDCFLDSSFYLGCNLCRFHIFILIIIYWFQKMNLYIQHFCRSGIKCFIRIN